MNTTAVTEEDAIQVTAQLQALGINAAWTDQEIKFSSGVPPMKIYHVQLSVPQAQLVVSDLKNLREISTRNPLIFEPEQNGLPVFAAESEIKVPAGKSAIIVPATLIADITKGRGAS